MYNGYLYIIHVREFHLQNRPIYKIGRTSDILKRFAQYPKNSKLLFVLPTTDAITFERLVLGSFRNKYIHNTEYGKEYFEGDLTNMINTMTRIVTSKSKFNCLLVEKSTQTGSTESTNVFEKFALQK
jgi:hypothetical protein